jgi:WD40-like Beta Propeller Repeat
MFERGCEFRSSSWPSRLSSSLQLPHGRSSGPVFLNGRSASRFALGLVPQWTDRLRPQLPAAAQVRPRAGVQHRGHACQRNRKGILARKDRRDTEEWDSDARWSPAGTSATFVRYIGLENTTLYLVRADGTGLRALTNSAPHDGAGVWSPTARRSPFPAIGRVIPGPGSGSSSRMGRDCGNSHRADFSPRWSPDGQTIAFGRTQMGREAILTVRTDGTGLRQLTEFGRARIDQWSADGQLFLYESGSDERPTVHTMRPDGSGKRTLVEGEHAAWSPDGSQLVFRRRRYTRRSPKESLFLARPSRPASCAAHLPGNERRNLVEGRDAPCIRGVWGLQRAGCVCVASFRPPDATDLERLPGSWHAAQRPARRNSGAGPDLGSRR